MNSVQLIGNLTRDPELRFTNGGTAVCTIPLAINRRKRNGDDQEPVYVDVVTWGAQADNVAQHLTKGRRVAVAGRPEFRRWTDAEARSHAKHEVVASEVQFLDPPRTGAAPTEPTYAPGEEPF
ncbi:MAG: single-stranded DNA-binding protein [Actinomycetota bacterium]|nr:single-stranded DNA-binding protein [Actinomycetota bacterium]